MDFQGLAYVEGDTAVHRADARAKVLGLFACSVAIFSVQTWWGMAAFSAAVIALAAVARIPARRMVVPLVPVIALAAFAAGCAIVASPTVVGVSGGLFVAMRMIVLVAASFIVCFTTTPTQLLGAFAWLIGPLRRARVPVDDIAFTLSLALRFIPMVAQEFAIVRAAQSARGADVDGVPFARKLRNWGAAFSAVFIGLFRRADTLASALDARCFGAPRSR